MEMFFGCIALVLAFRVLQEKAWLETTCLQQGLKLSAKGRWISQLQAEIQKLKCRSPDNEALQLELLGAQIEIADLQRHINMLTGVGRDEDDFLLEPAEEIESTRDYLPAPMSWKLTVVDDDGLELTQNYLGGNLDEMV